MVDSSIVFLDPSCGSIYHVHQHNDTPISLLDSCFMQYLVQCNVNHDLIVDRPSPKISKPLLKIVVSLYCKLLCATISWNKKSLYSQKKTTNIVNHPCLQSRCWPCACRHKVHNFQICTSCYYSQYKSNSLHSKWYSLQLHSFNTSTQALLHGGIIVNGPFGWITNCPCDNNLPFLQCIVY